MAAAPSGGGRRWKLPTVCVTAMVSPRSLWDRDCEANTRNAFRRTRRHCRGKSRDAPDRVESANDFSEQMLTGLATAALPTLAVLAGILINNQRLNDTNRHIDDVKESDTYRIEQVFDALLDRKS